MPKDMFIDFLKQKHAFQEYKDEVVGASLFDVTFSTVIDDLANGTVEPNQLLEDGFYFKHEEATTPIVWRELHEQWLSLLKEKA